MFSINPDDVYKMSPQRRELYLRIIDDLNPVHPVALRMMYIDEHMPDHKVEPALIWLISHRLIGKKFVEWFKGPCKDSDLEMLRLLQRIVDNEKLAPLIAGKNFKI